MKDNPLSGPPRILATAFLLLVGALSVATGCTTGPAQVADSAPAHLAALEATWGVLPQSIRLTGEGHFLDFRYRVMDAEKARPILDRSAKAYLKDTDTGKVLTVPVTKLGTMRGTSRQPKEGKQYFILFSNTDLTVAKGHRVTVIVGDFAAEGLTVQ